MGFRQRERSSRVSAPQKKRRTFWLADTVTAQHRDRALLLQQKGFDIQFFTSIDVVIQELEQKRAAVIVVSDDGDETVTETMVTQLMGIPEVQGARLILVRGAASERLNFLAACANFRDVIPFDLDEKQWLNRFMFATASGPVRLPQPVAQISASHIAAAAFPARLTWISERRLRFESRVRPPAGATLNLGGYLAAALGIPSISCMVVETQRSHLLYRFSDAVIADWTVPQAVRPKMLETLELLKQQDPGPRCRVFLAVQSPNLRSEILSNFADPRFEVTTALSKQGISEEPRFFSPDVIFFETALAMEDDGVRFAQMMANTHESATIVLVGDASGATEVQQFAKRFPGRRIVLMPKLVRNVTQSVANRYLHVSARRMLSEEPEARQLLPENPLSLAEVSFPARVTRLHPTAIQVAMPFAVGNFALGRVEAPALRKLIGRNPCVKITATYQDTHPEAQGFVYLADAALADLTSDEQKRLGEGLMRFVADAMARGATVGSSAVAAQVAVATPIVPASVAASNVVPIKVAQAQVAAHAVAHATNASASATAIAIDPSPSFTSQPTTVVATVSDSRAHEARINAAMARLEDTMTAPGFPLKEMSAPASSMGNEGGTYRSAAAELRGDVVRVVRNAQAEGLIMVLKYVAMVAFGLAIVWAIFALVAPHYEHSGGVYSEGLKKMAPHLQSTPPTKGK